MHLAFLLDKFKVCTKFILFSTLHLTTDINMAPHQNPFRPGAGQRPVYLAGRTKERDKFKQILEQRPILKNLILTGLRGIGKTVLLEELKPIAYEHHWLWANNEISESASMTEENMARRIVADLTSVLTPRISKQQSKIRFDSLHKP